MALYRHSKQEFSKLEGSYNKQKTGILPQYSGLRLVVLEAWEMQGV